MKRSARRRTIAGERPPLDLAGFGPALGLAGLAGVWRAAAETVPGATIGALTIYGASFLVWGWMIVRYTARTRVGSLLSDLRNPGRGPSLGFVPVVGLLLSSGTALVAPEVARVATWTFTALLAMLCAALLSAWLTGPLSRDDMHPSFLLPLVAGPMVASIAFTTVDIARAAQIALLVGVFFWLFVGPSVLARLLNGAPLQARTRPQLALLLAPPATGGVAWLLVYPQPSLVGDLSAVVVGFFVLTHLLLLRYYVTGPVSMLHWQFVFPATSTVNFVVRYFHTDSSLALTWALLATATVVTFTIGWVASRGTVPARAPHRLAPRFRYRLWFRGRRLARRHDRGHAGGTRKSAGHGTRPQNAGDPSRRQP